MKQLGNEPMTILNASIKMAVLLASLQCQPLFPFQVFSNTYIHSLTFLVAGLEFTHLQVSYFVRAIIVMAYPIL